MPAFSPARAEAEEAGFARELTGECVVEYPQEAAQQKRLTDKSVRSYATLSISDGLKLTWDADTAVRTLYLEWFDLPSAFTIRLLDASGGTLTAWEIDDPLYNDRFELDPAARSLQITVGAETRLATARLFSSGALPEALHVWQRPHEKADLLVISAHPDDELLYFGGTIPTYAGQRDLSVQVAYMAHGARVRVNEALDGLWLLGVRNAPVFLNFRDTYTVDLDSAARRWGYDVTLESIVGLIRRFRPEVIVSHDLDGEYGHGAHRLTAHCTLDAVSAAADGTRFPEAGEAWQAKKLYLHLFPEGALTMDWEQPLSAFGGKTALEMANLAYDCHASQQEYHKTVHAYGDYGSAYFGLAYTAVGQDETKGDFFEHIDQALLAGYVPPTPSPTPIPTATPMPTASPAPSPTPGATPAPMPTRRVPETGWLLLAAAAVALGALVSVLLCARRRKGKRKLNGNEP